MKKNIIILIACIFTSLTNLTFAAHSVEFFASNNTGEIDLRAAYQRLHSKEQSELENHIIATLQQFHIEQGHFDGVLGTYRMSSDQHITADNTERFTTSPLQEIADETIFNIATKLALQLNQESVALLVPDTNALAGMTVQFTSTNLPTIDEVVNIISNKLPTAYNQAYSLELASQDNDFDHARVSAVEWLGSRLNQADVMNAFPNEKIKVHTGRVFLVYKNGQREQL